ncbi:uncharacterized protein [Palaemon carinicauda]|uniref:uncharacterized protein isoform X2 n=1 Tax=Palaemon carinicauda TaxID=392227 RepID=UPI0035B6A706
MGSMEKTCCNSCSTISGGNLSSAQNEDMHKLQQVCRECSYQRHLDSTDKFVRFIIRHKKLEIMNNQQENTVPNSEGRSLAETSKPDEKMAIVLKLIDSAMKSIKREKTIISAIQEISTQHTNLVRGERLNKKVFIRRLFTKFKFLVKCEGIRFTAAAHKFMGKRKATKLIQARKVFSVEKRKILAEIEEDYIFAARKSLKVERERINALSVMVEREKINASSVTNKIIGKLFPKIRIENIPEYYANESIIDCIKDKNPWIENLVRNVNHFKMVTAMKTKISGLRHIVIKCSPKVRKNLKVRGDKLYVLDDYVMIYDNYHVVRCFKCQEFGHVIDKCTGRLVCPKCWEEHWMKDCTLFRATCLYCHGRHITGNKSCKRYKEEEEKVKEATDHGEHEEVMKDLTIVHEQFIKLKMEELLKTPTNYHSKYTVQRRIRY